MRCYDNIYNEISFNNYGKAVNCQNSVNFSMLDIRPCELTTLKLNYCQSCQYRTLFNQIRELNGYFAIFT